MFSKKQRKNSSEDTHNNSKTNKRAFRIPIALHVYTAFTIVIIFSFTSVNFAFNTIINSYVENECVSRIDNAYNSCQSFANAFRSSVTSDPTETSEDIRNNLLNAIITSTDISNDASMALISTEDDDSGSGYTLIWPTDSYSVSTIKRTTGVLDEIIDTDGIHKSSDVSGIMINGKMYYYKFVSVEYSSDESESESDYDTYYLLFYVDSSTYLSFASSINTALFRSMIISILIAGLVSVFVSFPIISSARKLTKFANRISKGDFKRAKHHIVSRELNELSDTMNQMAYRLDENDKEQKTFFQNASHELRTPLMSIQGYAEGIKYKVFDEDKHDEAVDIIISETTRLSGMVENLLTISKMDLSLSGNFTVKKQIVNVYELLGIVIENVRGSFLHSGKELRNDIRISDVYIYANENDIFRMLENIFSNCIRYSSSFVDFRCFADEKDVTFVISDDGPGISPELIPHIFDRFAKGSDGKHGIGLALVKSICAEHRGKISVFNRNDHVLAGTPEYSSKNGAVFIISLPITTPENQLTAINNNKE